jgi:Brp/Blh family beta-carotene 15,15'-monooxygenase
MNASSFRISGDRHVSLNSGWTLETLHSAAFVVLGALLLAGLASGVAINPLDAPLVAGIIILLLGVPHGGFDVAIWRRRNPTAGRTALVQMLSIYVGLAAGFFVLWLSVPELALPVFLMMAALHFAGDWDGALSILPRSTIAVAMLCSPAIFFADDVIAIFNWLGPAEVSQRFALVMHVVAIPALQASAVIVALLAVRDPLAAGEIAVVLALALLSPPLVFFLVYFCGLHSVRHMIRVHRELAPQTARGFLMAPWPYAPIAMLGTAVAALVLSSLPVGPALLGMIFMALGALTVPHMLLIDGTRPVAG